jgi:putative FmdB family regulatory protein
MPTYEYKCSTCEHTFEQFQQITARALKKCPECGKRKLIRLIGLGGGVIFKGSGFYCNDYKKQQPKRKKGEGNGKKEAGTLTVPKAPKKPNYKNKQNKSSG